MYTHDQYKENKFTFTSMHNSDVSFLFFNQLCAREVSQNECFLIISTMMLNILRMSTNVSVDFFSFLFLLSFWDRRPTSQCQVWIEHKQTCPPKGEAKPFKCATPSYNERNQIDQRIQPPHTTLEPTNQGQPPNHNHKSPRKIITKTTKRRASC